MEVVNPAFAQIIVIESESEFLPHLNLYLILQSSIAIFIDLFIYFKPSKGKLDTSPPHNIISFGIPPKDWDTGMGREVQKCKQTLYLHAYVLLKVIALFLCVAKKKRGM